MRASTKIHLENLKHRWLFVCWQTTLPRASQYQCSNCDVGLSSLFPSIFFPKTLRRIISLVKYLNILEIRESAST